MITLRNRETGRLYEAWQVPAEGEHPSEEMIEWLGKFPPDSWDGDDGGITVYDHSSVVIEESEVAFPGDYVARRLQRGRLQVIRASEIVTEFEVVA